MAERGGFEPPRVLSLPVFETGAFSRSATSPRLIRAVAVQAALKHPTDFRGFRNIAPVSIGPAFREQRRSNYRKISAWPVPSRFRRALELSLVLRKYEDFRGRGFDLKLIP